MSCCRQCEGLENVFDDGTAKSDLESYRREGPAKTTRLLLDHLRGAGVDGLTLLDIGGGVGAILVASGVRATVDVDASRAYLAAARSEAARRGYAGRKQRDGVMPTGRSITTAILLSWLPTSRRRTS